MTATLGTRQQFVRTCECGCGQPTLLATQTYRKSGWVKGQPLRFLATHRPNRTVYFDPCLAPGCEVTKPLTRGYCPMHHMRVKRTGSPDIVRPRPVRRGEAHHGWLGDEIGYRSLHARLQGIRGKASEHVCPCGAPAMHWAYDHSDPDERIAGDGEGMHAGLTYSTKLEHYVAMCISCHFTLDKGRKAS